MENPAAVPPRRQALRSLLLGGLVPVLAFSFVEEYYGTWWGLIAGMAFGVGEIAWERWKQGRVDTITWIGNGLLLVMGGVSLATAEGIWFKLQPAIIEAAMGILLIVSTIMGRAFLVMMAEKQGVFRQVRPDLAPFLRAAMGGLTVRIGIFFLLHAGLATWAALYWSTRAWLILKGFGFTGSMVVYMLVEMLFMRRRLAKQAAATRASAPPT